MLWRVRRFRVNNIFIVKTAEFSKIRRELINDDEFLELQSFLLDNHERGETISQTGGCKKIRWSRPGMGKRGGVRVIYYVRSASGKLYCLLVCPKSAKDDLSDKEKAILKAITYRLG